MYGLIGCSFVAFGLLAWRGRPDSRVGMLMTASGFGFFVAPLVTQFDGPVAFVVSVLFLDVWPFFLVALLLSLLTRVACSPASTDGWSRRTPSPCSCWRSP
jgi:hypothetical protein